MSPSPKSQNATPSFHSQGHAPWPIPPPPPPPAPAGGMAPQSQAPQRIANPNYGLQSANNPPPVSGGSSQGPAPGLPRISSPPLEVRPIMDNRPTSAGSGYQHHGYPPHHQNSVTPGIGMGAPGPSSHPIEMAREKEDRTPAPKRMREWEDDPMVGKQPTEEKRPRLDDVVPRPPSVANQPIQASPPSRHSLDADVRRGEDQRRAEPYHPSEAAHHPTLPAIQQQALSNQQPPQQLPRLSEPIKEERPREPQMEPASRKMDVDENYDDDGEEEKRPMSTKPERESSRGAAAAAVAAGAD